ncbi:MAG: cyclic nucleotide-binding domain-containing protein [Deltaproteobacteria bacterium]|nr:cyclic nucleotide-binding domain-containing protein [Deltaproteobacteria bacterium]
MARWAGEMEFEFVDGADDSGAFVATSKVVQFLRGHIARGEVEAAARLYEETGATVAKELLAEAKSASSSTQKHLAAMFAQARDFASAGHVFELAKDFAQAARSFEQASDFASAARCHQRSGDLVRAAAALERAGQLGAALELHQQSGPSDALAECLARQQRFWQAAQVYQQTANMRGEVEMLRLVPIDDAQRVPAVERLADLLERYGHMDQAAQIVIDTVRQCPAARNHTGLYQRLARLLEGLGRYDQANLVRARIQEQLGGRSVGDQRVLPAQASPPAVEGAPLAAAPAGAVITGTVLPPASAPRPITFAAMPAIHAVAAPAPAAAPIQAAAAAFQIPPAATPSSDPFSSLIDPFAERASGQAPAIDPYAQLKAIPIFGELTLVDMKDLYRMCQEVTFTSNATIIEQGVRGDGLTVILAGDVQVLRVEGSAATPLATLHAGAYVGEMSLVDDAATSARVVAATPVRALFISHERFDQYLYGHETAALCIYRLFAKTLAERLRQSNVRT